MKFFSSLLAAMLICGVVRAQTLEQARTEADAGHAQRAEQMYRELLQKDPNNVSALGGLADVLESTGHSRDAVEPLEKLIQLEPENVQRIYELGQIKSWQSGTRGQALDLLQRACKQAKSPEYCTGYADVLSWNAETRPQAIAELQEIVAAHRDYMRARLELAQILSWNEKTRPQALKLFDQGLAQQPRNTDLLIASAEVLSWNRMTRAEAVQRYDEVLKLNPNDARALAGKAQILAWQGNSDEALALYDKALAKDPSNAAALRGKAEILNWKGRYGEARSLAQQAQTAEPGNEQTSLELARAEIGMQHFAAARQDLGQLPPTENPDVIAAQQQVNRGLGTYLDFEYDLRRNHRNLDYDRFNAALSTPLNSANRITFSWQPSLYGTKQQDYNGNAFGVALDSEPSDRLTTHAALGVETFPNVPANVEGALDARYKLTSEISLKAGFERAPVEESFLSDRGEKIDGLFLGQVLSNLVDFGIGYNNARHHYDLSLDYSDGAYTGRNVDSNRRWGVSLDAGKQLRSDHPFVRVGYSMTYLSFDHDADIQSGQPLTSTTGGYFSPTEFLLNQGVLNLSYNWGRKVEWSMDGAAGSQNVANLGSSFGNTQFASSFGTHLLWRANAKNDLRVGYEYLNVFNAFQRNLFRVGWRKYF